MTINNCDHRDILLILAVLNHTRTKVVISCMYTLYKEIFVHILYRQGEFKTIFVTVELRYLEN